MTRCGKQWRTCSTQGARAGARESRSSPYSHSFSDDEKLYKTQEEREAEARRDPLSRLRAAAPIGGARIRRGAHRATRRCRAGSQRGGGSRHSPLRSRNPRPHPRFVFSPTSIPTSPAFATEPKPTGSPDTMVAAINATIPATRWRATHASSSSDRTWPTRAAKRRSRRCPARAASSR